MPRISNPQNRPRPWALRIELKRCLLQLGELIAITAVLITLSSWGFTAHRHIVDVCVAWLPTEMRSFYKEHRAWLIEHALDADLRKHSIAEESPRHYIDLDAYHGDCDTLQRWFPLSWEAAVTRWDEQTVLNRGVGPWHANSVYHRLVNAFVRVDTTAILRHSIDLAHYLADLHVPLHTTSNYNGQFSNQLGIHALWETQIPEQFLPFYALHPDGNDFRCEYLENVQRHIWDAALTSHRALDHTFDAELQTRMQFEGMPIDAYTQRGRVRQLLRTESFVIAYESQLNGQVHHQMRLSVASISSCWYSAWVDAGQPPLRPATSRQVCVWKKVVDWLVK